jgi:hypothetical protein
VRRSSSFFAICGMRPLRWAVLGTLAVVAVSVTGPVSPKAYAATGWQKLTQAELTVIWWEWLYSIPASQSPAFDDSGANAYNGQPFSDLLLLAGTRTSTTVGGDVLSIETNGRHRLAGCCVNRCSSGWPATRT